MDMGQLESMRIFITVVETGSITKAAERLNLAKSAISKRLSELEHQLGVKLLNRTTRTSSLTEAGQVYLNKCKLILDEVDDLHCHISSTSSKLNGVLKLAVPLTFGLKHLVPALDNFAKLHPELKLDIDFSDKKIDLVEDGVNLAIRIGSLSNSTLRAKPLAPIHHVLCVSPDYLTEHGHITTPNDLKSHKLLRYSQQPLSGVELIDNNNKTMTVPMESFCIANNGDFLKTMAVSGHGVLFTPKFIVWEELANGSLIPIMTDYRFNSIKAYAVYPETRYLPRKVRMLIDFLSEYFGNEPYWDK